MKRIKGALVSFFTANQLANRTNSAPSITNNSADIRVLSVNGRTGRVVLTKDDVDLDNVENVLAIPMSYLSTDVDLGDASDKVPSQGAVKTYVDSVSLPLSYLSTDVDLGNASNKVPSQGAVKTYVDNVSFGSGSVAVGSRFVPLVLIIGESNSGGYALNSEAPSDEIGTRSNIKILNPTTLVFESLNIGVNNLLDHAGLSNGVTHGFELQLANSVDAGEWMTDTVYLVKAGQGGSQLSQWNTGDTYFNKFVERINAAKNLLKDEEKIPIIYIFCSIGINDAIAGTPTATYKTEMLDWFERIRSYVGFAPIIMTKFMSNYSTYNTAIDELSAYAMNFSVVTTDAGLRDANHWNYSGMKLVSGRLIDIALNTIGQFEQYQLFQAYVLSGGSSLLTVSVPTFTPSAATFSSTQSVSITTATSGATIYYTIDGSAPTTGSTQYSSAISIASTTTLKAIAVKSGLNNSGITTGTFTISSGTVSTPTFSPSAATFSSTQSVSITTATSGAAIYYTTNGTTPTSSSTLYSTAISVASTTTLKAIAIKSGLTDSAVASGTFTIQVATPTFSPSAGTFSDTQSVSITTATSGSTIYYTTDGTTPTTGSTQYSTALSVASTTTLKAIAVKSGLTNSAVATGTFTIDASTVSTPTFSPSAGTFDSTQSVSISCSTSGSTIYYTTNGTTPTSSSTLYSTAVSVASTTTLKAIAIKSGLTDSAVASGTFTIQVATPTFSPSAGTFDSTQSVSISCSTSGSTIYYTTNGTTPTSSSTLYSTAVSVASTTTLKAIAVKSGIDDSAVVSGTFTIQAALSILTWNNLQNATDANGFINYTSGSTVGGTSIEVIDATQDFIVEVDIASASPTLAIVVGLVSSSQNDHNYAWGGTQNFVTAVYQNVTFNTITTNSAILNTGPSFSSYPSKLRMRKSGNDVITSYDFGNTGTFTDQYTVTNALVGVDSLNVKVLFAVPSSGQKIKVSANQITATVSTPTFSPSAATFSSTQSVSISTATSGATIYYTTDGTTPTTGSTLYSTAISVSSTTTLKAIAVKSGSTNSAIASGTFTISGGGGFSGSFTGFTWTSLTNTTDSGSGLISASGSSTPMGAYSTQSIDVTQPFEIELLFNDQDNTNAIVVILDTVNSGNYVWAGSQVWPFGIYQYNGSLYVPVGGYAATGQGSITFTSKIRWTKSGNDIVITKSTDDFQSSSEVQTLTNVLSGLTTCYIKTIFAAPSGTSAINISYRTS